MPLKPISYTCIEEMLKLGMWKQQGQIVVCETSWEMSIKAGQRQGCCPTISEPGEGNRSVMVAGVSQQSMAMMQVQDQDR